MGLLRIKKEIIERKINSELLNLLTEEQSIAKVVSDKSSEICNLICKDYVKIKGNKTAKYVLRSNAFVYSLFDNFEITVIYNFYNFRTYNDYEESINAVSMVGSSSFEKKIITLNFFAISGDVDGKTAIIIDDMVDTAGTLTAGIKMLKDKGAKAVYASCSHGILSGPAIDRLKAAKLAGFVCTNTIDQTENQKIYPEMTVLSMAPLLAGLIHAVEENSSLSEVLAHAFDD